MVAALDPRPPASERPPFQKTEMGDMYNLLLNVSYCFHHSIPRGISLEIKGRYQSLP
jgi:hypothetical protein